MGKATNTASLFPSGRQSSVKLRLRKSSSRVPALPVASATYTDGRAGSCTEGPAIDGASNILPSRPAHISRAHRNAMNLSVMPVD